jgi:hypothetical protein
VKGLFFDWLRAHRPELIPRYEALYRRGAYMPVAERERLAQLAGEVDWAPREGARGRLPATPEPDERGRAVVPQRATGPDQQRLF